MELNKEDKEKILQAGKIASEARAYARTIIKRGVPVLEIAEKIEEKIEQLGARPAFPVNLSINEIAAHYTPSHDDKTLAHGLLKVDFGVSVDGFCSDNAMSFDLENSEENKNLIKAAESALDEAIKVAKYNVKLSQIGSVIEKKIKSFQSMPIQNLCGHSITHNTLHSGVFIPNVDNSTSQILEEGVYAIEPFSTTGLGAVRDSKPSGIYHIEREGNVRDGFAREVLTF